MRKYMIFAALGLLMTLGGGIWLWPDTEKDMDTLSSGQDTAGSRAASNPETTTFRERGSLPLLEENEPAPVLRFHPPSGAFLAYRFETEANAWIDIDFLMPESGIRREESQDSHDEVQTRASGELRLKFFSREPDRWDVAGVITNLDYRIGGEVPYWIDAMRHPFAFRMDSRGRLDHFRFTKGIPTVAQELTREILYSMQVLFPEERKAFWKTREVDPRGRYRAEYVLKTVDRKQGRIDLEKRKTDYISTRLVRNPLNRDAGASRPRIEESIADIQLSESWLEEIRYREKSRSSAKGREWSAGSRSFFAERIRMSGGGDFPETFAAFRERLNEDVYLIAEAYQTDPALNRLGAGLKAEEAIELYLRLRDSDSEEERRLAEKFMVNYLRQYPWASFDLVDILDTSTEAQIDDSTQLVLWRLLTEAGHQEAQQALGQAAAGHGYSELTRWRAVVYAHDFERPGPELVNSLWQVENARDGGKDSELRNMALYALGTLGGKEDVSESLGRDLRRQLNDRLLASGSVDEQVVALAAIGNTGAAEMIDTITPHLFSTDSRVRAAACDALRRMENAEAAEVLMRHYESEGSPAVRETAARTLAGLPPNPQSTQWARREVLHAQDPEEQVAMVHLLGRSLEQFPENESALRQLLDRDPARKVKREVFRYIAPY